MKLEKLDDHDIYSIIECIMSKPEDIIIEYHFKLIEKLLRMRKK